MKKTIYWLLIGTFSILYLIVATVSLLHAIEFFGLGNNPALSVLLSIGFEVGQGAVLFSMLTTNNKHQFMTWVMMILLTSVQIVANVFSTFKYMILNGGDTWTYWQRSILFWMEETNPEIYQVTIAWIIGAILPLVALGMIALVSDNIKMYTGNAALDDGDYNDEEDYEYVDVDEDDTEEAAKKTNSEQKTSESLELTADGPGFKDAFQEAVEKTPAYKEFTTSSQTQLISSKSIDDLIMDKDDAIDDNYWLKDSKSKSNEVETDSIVDEIYTEPIIDDKDQIRLNFDETETGDHHTDDSDDSDYGEILEKGIDEIIEESNYDEPDDLGKK